MHIVQIDLILKTVGLKRRIIAKHPEFYVCDKAKFINYVSKEYQHNLELKKMDETYRMHEQILLHKETGLRFRYSTHENYFGDEIEYKYIEIFAFNNLNQLLKILDVDFESKQIKASDSIISFEETSKTI